MSEATFDMGDSVDVRAASRNKWQRGMLLAIRNDPRTFMVQLDETGVTGWYPASRVRRNVSSLPRRAAA